MLLTEYNERKYMKMFRKEAQKEGREEGIQAERGRLINAMLQNGVSAGQIASQTGLSLSEIEAARQNGQKKREKLFRRP